MCVCVTTGPGCCRSTAFRIFFIIDAYVHMCVCLCLCMCMRMGMCICMCTCSCIGMCVYVRVFTLSMFIPAIPQHSLRPSSLQCCCCGSIVQNTENSKITLTGALNKCIHFLIYLYALQGWRIYYISAQRRQDGAQNGPNGNKKRPKGNQKDYLTVWTGRVMPSPYRQVVLLGPFWALFEPI